MQGAHAAGDHLLADVHCFPYGGGGRVEVQVEEYVHIGEVEAAQVHGAKQVPARHYRVRSGVALGNGAVAGSGGVHVGGGDDGAHIAVERAEAHLDVAAIRGHGHVLVGIAAADHDRGGRGCIVGDGGRAIGAAAITDCCGGVVVVRQGIHAAGNRRGHRDHIAVGAGAARCLGTHTVVVSGAGGEAANRLGCARHRQVVVAGYEAGLASGIHGNGTDAAGASTCYGTVVHAGVGGHDPAQVHVRLVLAGSGQGQVGELARCDIVRHRHSAAGHVRPCTTGTDPVLYLEVLWAAIGTLLNGGKGEVGIARGYKADLPALAIVSRVPSIQVQLIVTG